MFGDLSLEGGRSLSSLAVCVVTVFSDGLTAYLSVSLDHCRSVLESGVCYKDRLTECQCIDVQNICFGAGIAIRRQTLRGRV
jgi:hypothetical protein